MLENGKWPLKADFFKLSENATDIDNHCLLNSNKRFLSCLWPYTQHIWHLQHSNDNSNRVHVPVEALLELLIVIFVWLLPRLLFLRSHILLIIKPVIPLIFKMEQFEWIGAELEKKPFYSKKLILPFYHFWTLTKIKVNFSATMNFNACETKVNNDVE